MMSNPSKRQLILSSESSQPINSHTSDSMINMASSPPNSSNMNLSQGPVAILWDIENCPVPSDIRPEDVAINIRMALRVHPIIRGAVTVFSAYGDFNAFPRRVREGCQRTGVKLIDVPNGRKDAADKAILVDMFLFALDNHPPSSIMLISGDVDFAPALHVLGQRGYTIILVIPSGVGVSSALCNAGQFVWEWQSVAHGEGFVPPIRPLMAPLHKGHNEISGHLKASQSCENRENLEEEAIVYRGMSQTYYNNRDFSIVSQSLSEYTTGTSLALRSQSLASALNEATPSSSALEQNDAYYGWVQPGDLNGLKGQLVKLLEQSGGCLPLARIPADYPKFFGRPLYISEYGACKLVDLLKKFSDVMVVEGKGQRRNVYLKNFRAGSTNTVLQISSSLGKVKKGKGIQERNVKEGANVASGSSDEISLSDDERVVAEETNGSTGFKAASTPANLGVEKRGSELPCFKWELEEILVSYSGKIYLGGFEAIYQQRYKSTLDYRRFGVGNLEELLDKLQDVAVVREEPVSKRKFVTALGN